MVEEYHCAGQHADSTPHIVQYLVLHPQSKPGAILRHELPTDISYQNHLPAGNNQWALFASEVDWHIAKWAKLHSTGLTAFSELLTIDSVHTLSCIMIPGTSELIYATNFTALRGTWTFVQDHSRTE